MISFRFMAKWCSSMSCMISLMKHMICYTQLIFFIATQSWRIDLGSQGQLSLPSSQVNNVIKSICKIRHAISFCKAYKRPSLGAVASTTETNLHFLLEHPAKPSPQLSLLFINADPLLSCGIIQEPSEFKWHIRPLNFEKSMLVERIHVGYELLILSCLNFLLNAILQALKHVSPPHQVLALINNVRLLNSGPWVQQI